MDGYRAKKAVRIGWWSQMVVHVELSHGRDTRIKGGKASSQTTSHTDTIFDIYHITFLLCAICSYLVFSFVHNGEIVI